MQCYNHRTVERLRGRQQQEKVRLPKIQRSEGKTRMTMYKKSLRIAHSGNAAEDREKVKQVSAVAFKCRIEPCGAVCYGLRSWSFQPAQAMFLIAAPLSF